MCACLMSHILYALVSFRPQMTIAMVAQLAVVVSMMVNEARMVSVRLQICDELVMMAHQNDARLV